MCTAVNTCQTLQTVFVSLGVRAEARAILESALEAVVLKNADHSKQQKKPVVFNATSWPIDVCVEVDGKKGTGKCYWRAVAEP